MTANRMLKAEERDLAVSPVRREDLMVEEIDGEAIIYDSHNGAVHRFNETTFFVWNACDGSQSQADITVALGKAYSIDSDQAASHVGNAIAGFRDRDLLIIEPSASMSSRNDQPQPAADLKVNKPSHRLSRRELIGSGMTKAILAAPVISTFFAAGAYASGPSASAAFGTDGGGDCKTVGYSCAAQGDCCDGGTTTDCEASSCCLNPGEAGCTVDSDCCQSKTCSGGTCAV